MNSGGWHRRRMTVVEGQPLPRGHRDALLLVLLLDRIAVRVARCREPYLVGENLLDALRGCEGDLTNTLRDEAKCEVYPPDRRDVNREVIDDTSVAHPCSVLVRGGLLDRVHQLLRGVLPRPELDDLERGSHDVHRVGLLPSHPSRVLGVTLSEVHHLVDEPLHDVDPRLREFLVLVATPRGRHKNRSHADHALEAGVRNLDAREVPLPPEQEIRVVEGCPAHFTAWASPFFRRRAR